MSNKKQKERKEKKRKEKAKARVLNRRHYLRQQQKLEKELTDLKQSQEPKLVPYRKQDNDNQH